MEARHRLFFAIRPPAGLLPEIARLRDRDGTGRGRVEEDRLHLTTYLFADHPVLPPGLVEAACAAAGEPDAFHIVLDRLVGDEHGLRLVPSEPIRGYEAFQRSLAERIAHAGLTARAGWRFAPHLTLRYGGRQQIDEAVDAISWRVEDLVLIDSVLGAHRHETVALWHLR